MTNPSEASGPRRILKAIDRKKNAQESFEAEIATQRQFNHQNMTAMCGFSKIQPLQHNVAFERFLDYHCTALAVEQVLRTRMSSELAALATRIDDLIETLFHQPGAPSSQQNEDLASEHAPAVGEMTDDEKLAVKLGAV